MRVAHVSTFPPLKCGIAFFASDLIAALPGVVNDRYALHYGDDPPQVEGDANVNRRSELVALAKVISQSACDVVVIQHEFGIWGGALGENLLPFLDNLHKPVVSVLHTTFGPHVRPAQQRKLLDRLITRSKGIVLFTESAKRTLETLLERPLLHAVVIPHGVPRIPYRQIPALIEAGRACALRLITPGFYREDKGFETILRALALLVHRGFDVSYEIAGQPQQQFSPQALYRECIDRMIDELMLRGRVHCDPRFLSVEEQISAIQRNHIGVFAYQDPAQSSSGTVPLVMAAGRPVVCTPFEYAAAKHAEGPGVFVAKGYDAHACADAIERIWSIDCLSRLAAQTYERTEHWEWGHVGRMYFDQFRLALS